MRIPTVFQHCLRAFLLCSSTFCMHFYFLCAHSYCIPALCACIPTTFQYFSCAFLYAVLCVYVCMCVCVYVFSQQASYPTLVRECEGDTSQSVFVFMALGRFACLSLCSDCYIVIAASLCSEKIMHALRIVLRSVL